MEVAYESFKEPVTRVHCDQPELIENFDGAAYMGVWYEQQSVINKGFVANDVVCTVADYWGLSSDGHFSVTNSY